MHTLLQDLRYALRMCRKNSGFTFVVITTLALGIGANTAIFSLLDTAIFRSLPIPEAERLTIFKWTARNSPDTKGYYRFMPCPPTSAPAITSKTQADPDSAGEHGCSFSYPLFQQFRSLSDAFSGVAAITGEIGLNLRGNGPVSFVIGEVVTGNFFDTVGVPAALGRLLTSADDAPAAPPVAILGYGYWQRAFAGDPNIRGKTIWLNDLPVTIVGVASKTFPSIDPTRSRDVWVPLSLQQQLGKDMYGSINGDHPSVGAGEKVLWLYIVARLKPGVPLAAAQANAQSVFANDVLSESTALFKAKDDPRLVLMPAPQGIVGLHDRFSQSLSILMVAVGAVLLIACANVAGLMLARSAARQKEMAVRLVLGAGRVRIARQVLTESILLSLAGGAAGILLAYWSVRSLVALMSRGGMWPSHIQVALDTPVLLFTAAVALLTGILFGLAPALRGMRVDLTPALKESTAFFAASGSQTRRWGLGDVLVAAQVALSLVVLTGAVLLLRTLENLKNINPGFDTTNVLLFYINPEINGYTDQQTHTLYSELQQRLSALPGVLGITYSYDALLSGNSWITSFYVEGEAAKPQHVSLGLQVGPGFFEAMHIPLLSGRTLSPQDFTVGPDSTWDPVVINQSFAQQFFRDQNPIGKHLTGFRADGAVHEIVGVVADAKYRALRSELAPTLYVAQRGGAARFDVRTKANPLALVPAIRAAVSQLDDNLPVSGVTTQSEQIERSMFQERLMTRLSALFGGLSLTLACVGLYGLLSYEVTRRTREIGVRLALGAQPGNILRLVVLHGMSLSTLGSVIGIAAALGLTRYLGSLLYGVHPNDPLTFAAVAILVAIVALAACVIPSRRAMRVEPITALREE
jgi:predicted permease